MIPPYRLLSVLNSRLQQLENQLSDKQQQPFQPNDPATRLYDKIISVRIEELEWIISKIKILV